jgi:hypothetical protein
LNKRWVLSTGLQWIAGRRHDTPQDHTASIPACDATSCIRLEV